MPWGVKGKGIRTGENKANRDKTGKALFSVFSVASCSAFLVDAQAAQIIWYN
jgi:hypothetical protein